MAEGGIQGTNRIFLIAATVVLVFSLFSLLVTGRSCGRAPKDDGYVAIFTGLDLKDASNVVVQLKALKIVYKLKDEGKTISVPKDKADEARIGLAQKNLPAGGSVGWEIFDESKLGATDFDRRVQFVRAISGELARTIKRIDAIGDARVQIVIPQTQLFEVTKVPVTASVLIQLKPGRHLTREQVNGIVRLVASSVENLLSENVTIVDIYGNVLTNNFGSLEASYEQPELPKPMIIASEKTPEPKQDVMMQTPTSETTALTVETPVLAEQPVEKKILTRLEIKEQIENKLSSRAQALVNKFYPPNSILIKVTVELPDKKPSTGGVVQAKAGKWKSKMVPPKKKASNQPIIKKLSAIVLIDNRFNLTLSLKKTTYDTIAGAISLKGSRGDTIIIRQVPFHYASMIQMEPPQGANKMAERKGLSGGIMALFKGRAIIPIVLFFGAAVFFFVIIRIRLSSRARSREAVRAENRAAMQPTQNNPLIEELYSVVSGSPDKVSEILKKWLSEGQ